jgi:hypothetical protein
MSYIEFSLLKRINKIKDILLRLTLFINKIIWKLSFYYAYPRSNENVYIFLKLQKPCAIYLAPAAPIEFSL